MSEHACPKSFRHILADDGNIYEFRPDHDGTDTVTVIHKSLKGRHGGMTTLTLAAARSLWIRLVQKGFWRW